MKRYTCHTREEPVVVRHTRVIFVRSIKRRFVYVPAPKDPLAYDVTEYSISEPEPGDQVVKDMWELEDIRVKLGLRHRFRHLPKAAWNVTRTESHGAASRPAETRREYYVD